MFTNISNVYSCMGIAISVNNQLSNIGTENQLLIKQTWKNLLRETS